MKRIDTLIDGLSRKFELGKALKRQKALRNWKEAAGSELARYARPEGFERDLLRIKVLHPAAAMELRLRKNEILEKLNSLAGEELFTELKVISRGTGKGVHIERSR